MRVVLDTNIVLSALLFTHGSAAWLRRAWQQRTVVPLLSTETIRELMRVLTYPKFKLSTADQEELLADYLPYGESIQVPVTVKVVPACRDPNDLPFLRLAIKAQAAYLVTGDADLLALKRDCPVPVITLAELKSLLS